MRNTGTERAVGRRLVVVMLLALTFIPSHAEIRAASTRASRGAGRSASPAHVTSNHGAARSPARAQATAVRTVPGVPHRAMGRATYGAYPPYHGSYPYPGGCGSWGWAWWPSSYFGVGWYPAPYSYAVTDSVGSAADATAILETDVHPRSAAVQLDGEMVGTARDYSGTWDDLRVGAGKHTLEFGAPGYMTLRIHLNARPGAVYRIEQDLQKGAGMDPRSEFSAEPGVVRIGPGSEGESETRAGEGGPSASRSPSLRRGLLKIVASPPDAAIYLDGEFLATARELSQLHGAISVALGVHHIEAVRPGFPAQSVDVDVASSGPARVHIDLAGSGDANVD